MEKISLVMRRGFLILAAVYLVVISITLEISYLAATYRFLLEFLESVATYPFIDWGSVIASCAAFFGSIFMACIILAYVWFNAKNTSLNDIKELW